MYSRRSPFFSLSFFFFLIRDGSLSFGLSFATRFLKNEPPIRSATFKDTRFPSKTFRPTPLEGRLAFSSSLARPISRSYPRRFRHRNISTSRDRRTICISYILTAHADAYPMHVHSLTSSNRPGAIAAYRSDVAQPRCTELFMQAYFAKALM